MTVYTVTCPSRDLFEPQGRDLPGVTKSYQRVTGEPDISCPMSIVEGLISTPNTVVDAVAAKHFRVEEVFDELRHQPARYRVFGCGRTREYLLSSEAYRYRVLDPRVFQE